MRARGALVAGGVVSGLLAGYAGVAWMQNGHVSGLAGALRWMAWAWVLIGGVHVLLHGVPARRDGSRSELLRGRWLLWLAAAVSAVWVGVALSFAFRHGDPVVALGAARPVVHVWLVAGVVFALAYGVPFQHRSSSMPGSLGRVMVSRLVLGGSVVSVLLVLFGVLFFFQYKDPMILLFSVQALVPVWLVVGIVHVLRHGIPVRIVASPPQPPREDEQES